MPPPTTFEEIHVYEGVAEKTGVRFKRNDVRRSDGCCRSLTELLRKDRPESRTHEGRPWRVSAGEQVDSLEMFALLGLHRTDESELVEDTGALRH